MALASLLLAGCQSAGPVAAPAAAPSPAAADADAVPDYVTAICGECHAVKDNAVSVNPQAPGFADIANSPGLTRDTLVTFLSDAHNYPMQMDVDLVDEDIEVIADYMLTLRSDDYIKRPS
ncbi:MAG: mono/diheme cytochrome c family protein [Qipengyuania sp.]|jgi:mono/diheme cytochrome c family protein